VEDGMGLVERKKFKLTEETTVWSIYEGRGIPSRSMTLPAGTVVDLKIWDKTDSFTSFTEVHYTISYPGKSQRFGGNVDYTCHRRVLRAKEGQEEKFQNYLARVYQGNLPEYIVIK
jgi:hypothetical protein